MKRWTVLDKVKIPGEVKELCLYQRDEEFAIKVGPYELMNSRAHNSEDALGRLSCMKINKIKEQRVLIGGLGMGFTLRKALDNLKGKARVTVAELVPAVVEWNRQYLAHLAKSPLDDPRVQIFEGDVNVKIRTVKDFYHAIILDVDNGAQGITQQKNESLYSQRGLRAAYDALQSGGVLAIWSAESDDRFKYSLGKANFKVEEMAVRARSGPKGGPHVAIIWLAIKE